MNRFLAAFCLDLMLQLRYGFIYTAGFSLVVWLTVLRALPQQALPVAVPLVVFLDLSIIGFYFIAGMVLFEKSENTLSALVVSPLRFWEYLFSKLISLTLMAVIVSLLLILFNPTGEDLNLAVGLFGVVSMSFISLLLGLISVSPFTSISTYLIPSQAFVLVLYAPLVSYLGWGDSPLLYFFPTQGALLLLKGLFSQVQVWQVWFAGLSGLAWVVGLMAIAKRCFNRYIIANQGEG